MKNALILLTLFVSAFYQCKGDVEYSNQSIFGSEVYVLVTTYYDVWQSNGGRETWTEHETVPYKVKSGDTLTLLDTIYEERNSQESVFIVETYSMEYSFLTWVAQPEDPTIPAEVEEPIEYEEIEEYEEVESVVEVVDQQPTQEEYDMVDWGEIDHTNYMLFDQYFYGY
jgi:hypothetical protein